MPSSPHIPPLLVEKIDPSVKIPVRQNSTDSCVDVCAFKFGLLFRKGEPVEAENGTAVGDMTSITLDTMDRVLISTGLRVTVGEGYEIQIRSRSGLTLKNGLVVANGIGTIDEQYRGDLGVVLINISGKKQTIELGERIAQIAVCPIILSDIRIVTSLDSTTRGTGGFGSTGRK